jgi:hypothetical protein
MNEIVEVEYQDYPRPKSMIPVHTAMIEGANILKILKWLRIHGKKGSDWDFMGTTRKISIYIYCPKLVVIYMLKWS